MIKIYADFNSCDEQGRVRLSTVGSLESINQYKELLAEGMRVILYTTGEFEVCGTLVFEKIWLGIPDWSTIHYLNPEDAPDLPPK